MNMKGLFIASTGQHVGKTTICLGLFSGLKKRFSHIEYMKPIGQEQSLVKKNLSVDKDVLIFKEHFCLKTAYEDMSPVLIPPGFTRQFLDQKIDQKELMQRILNAAKTLHKKEGFILAEGTGHCGVGSIINLNNAQVASLLNIPIVLVASGGLGSAFDELMLNKTLCDLHGAKVIGVILNRVITKKKEMIDHYMPKALSQWNIPLLGSIPFDSFLSNPSMKDFETLFETKLLTGNEHVLRHPKDIRLVATSVETYRESVAKGQLIITPANREDIILATLSKYWDAKIADSDDDLNIGMILTGDYPPRHYIVEELQNAHIPMLYTPFHSDTVMKMISSFTAKIQTEDVEKIHEAIDVVEKHIDFELLNDQLYR